MSYAVRLWVAPGRVWAASNKQAAWLTQGGMVGKLDTAGTWDEELEARAAWVARSCGSLKYSLYKVELMKVEES